MNERKSCDNYKKAEKIVKEASKNIRYCGIQGPTGPRGEAGAATIRIGRTETIDENEEAQVYNVGTNEDVILNFKIPKGSIGPTVSKGEKGEMGPRGLPGEIGISEHIAIDETTTLEANEEASVQDTFDGRVHHLVFFIPKGEQGPQGETGATGKSPNPVYGHRYLNVNESKMFTKDIDNIVTLNEEGPALFTSYDTENAINIKEYGFYLISYTFSGIPTTDATILLSTKANDLTLASSNIKVTFQGNIANTVTNTFIASLNTDEAITLNIRPDNDTTITFDGTTNASLSIIKIH